jgi:hypothetical protein
MLAKTPIENILYDKELIINFLESKDPKERYSYHLSSECAFAQFLFSHGFAPEEFYVNHQGGLCIPPGIWHEITNGGIYTFGEALKRARALLKYK